MSIVGVSFGECANLFVLEIACQLLDVSNDRCDRAQTIKFTVKLWIEYI